MLKKIQLHQKTKKNQLLELKCTNFRIVL